MAGGAGAIPNIIARPHLVLCCFKKLAALGRSGKRKTPCIIYQAAPIYTLYGEMSSERRDRETRGENVKREMRNGEPGNEKREGPPRNYIISRICSLRLQSSRVSQAVTRGDDGCWRGGEAEALDEASIQR